MIQPLTTSKPHGEDIPAPQGATHIEELKSISLCARAGLAEKKPDETGPWHGVRAGTQAELDVTAQARC